MTRKFKVGDLVWWTGNNHAGILPCSGHMYCVEGIRVGGGIDLKDHGLDWSPDCCSLVRVGDEVEVAGPGNCQEWVDHIRKHDDRIIQGKIKSLFPFKITWNRKIGGTLRCGWTNFTSYDSTPELRLVKPANGETIKEDNKKKDYPPGRRIRL